MSDILSKVTASGLSAGVFLLWWPAHVSSRGSAALLARGVLWALAFEVLLLGFRPLERAVGRAIRTREADALAPRRIAPLLALAAIAAVAPVTMLCGARAPIAAPTRAAAPKVIVKREIVLREVVVRRVSHVVRVPVPAASTATPATTPVPKATFRTATPKRASTTTAAKTPTTAKTQADTTADTKSDVRPSATSTAIPKPAITAGTTQPTTTAAPAASTAATPAAAKSAGS